MGDETLKSLREQLAELEVRKARIKGTLKESADEDFALAASLIGGALRDMRNFVAEELRRRRLGESVVWWG
jgi:hypothetical protein